MNKCGFEKNIPTDHLSTPFQLIANAEFLISQSQGSKSKHLGMYTQLWQPFEVQMLH